MKVDKSSMLLYAVTDRAWLREQTLIDQVEEAIKGGATFIQLREKDLSYDKFLQEAKQIKKLTDSNDIPFVINDNVEIALACDADGVHIGQEDMPVATVRKILGSEKILGVSAETVEQALKAEQDGADYLGVGSVFPTSTKLDAEPVSIQTLKNICTKVSIPVVAIGGIKAENILQLRGSGIDGVAVVSAIFAQPDILQATQKLLSLSRQMLEG